MVSLVETPPILQAIGLVTVRWASVDLDIATILGEVLHNKEAGLSCVFDSTDSGLRRFETSIAIVGSSSLPEGDRRHLIEIAKKLKLLLNERNRIVHSPLVWSAFSDGEKMGMRLSRIGRISKAEKSRFKEITEADILSHAESVKECARPFFEWWMKRSFERR